MDVGTGVVTLLDRRPRGERLDETEHAEEKAAEDEVENGQREIIRRRLVDDDRKWEGRRLLVDQKAGVTAMERRVVV